MRFEEGENEGFTPLWGEVTRHPDTIKEGK